MKSWSNWRKGFIGVLAACTCAASLAFAVPAVSFAGDDTGDSGISLLHNRDIPFDFHFTFWSTSDRATIERKDNDSSAYVYLKSVDIDAAQLYVDGRSPGTSTFHNCMGGADAVVNRGLRGQYCIRNLVYERYGGAYGYADAQLTGWGMGNEGNITGEWSPDSMYAYTPLNGFCNPNIW